MVSYVKKIKKEGYKPFYCYGNGHIVVYVNNQSDFQEDLLDVYGSGATTLTAAEAREARNMIPSRYHNYYIDIEIYRDYLNINHFDLEKE